MSALTFRHRVAVDSPVGYRLFWTDAKLAGELLRDGGTVYALKGSDVAVIRVTAQQVIDLHKNELRAELWPGSYGIAQVHFGGGRYYEHRSTREAELDVAA